MINFKNFITNNKIVGLSPMDGITDEAFRLVQTQIAKPDVIFTEFVSAEGISRGGVKLYDTLLYSPEEHPIVGQLFGKDPESFYKSAIILSHLGFDGIDINMGCPAKTVVHHGSGAALIDKPKLASEIITSVQKGVDDWFNNKITINDLNLNQKTLKIINRNIKYSNRQSTIDNRQSKVRPTISVKTRLGISESIINTWIPHLLQHDLDFLTIHSRTLKQGYSGQANWDEIAKVVNLAKDTKTLIWGNGDVSTKKQGIEYCQKYGVKGVLIGRACMGNPWVFSKITPTTKDKFSTMLLHAQIFKETFPNRMFDSLRKHFLLYASGLSNAKKLRSQIVRLNNIEELYQLEQAFLNC